MVVATTVSDAFSAFAALVGRLETTGRDVVGVGTRDLGSGDGDAVLIDLSVRTSFFDDVDAEGVELTPYSASVNEDGTATVDLTVSIPRSIRSESATPRSGHDGIEDGVREPTGTDDRRRTGDVPVHRDPDRLREVYAACDTFAEMTEALGADVTAVTVRRNMIKHGIHEPQPNGSVSRGDDGGTDADLDSDSGADADPGFVDPAADPETDPGGETTGDVTVRDTDDPVTDDRVSPDASDRPTDDAPPDDTAGPDGAPDSAFDEESTSDDEPTTGEESSEPADEAVVIPDGIGFPHDLTLDRLTAVVGTSKTLHEAGTRLGLDRDQTRELLGDLGVLDLVHGRVSTRHERTASPEEIDERIRERLSRST